MPTTPADDLEPAGAGDAEDPPADREERHIRATIDALSTPAPRAGMQDDDAKAAALRAMLDEVAVTAE
jgi:hypothetical protein